MFDTDKQSIIAQSSTDSEIIGNDKYNKAIIWARGLLQELGFDQRSVLPEGTPTGEDNTSCMKILLDECSNGKTRHLNLRMKALRESLKAKNFQMFHLPTTDMIADLGTKALPPGLFNKLSSYLLGHTTLEYFLPFLISIPTNSSSVLPLVALSPR